MKEPDTLGPRHLPDDSSVREQYPLADGLFFYFPAALLEVARWSKVGGAKYNKDKLRWVREESTDHENKILRHLLDARQVDENGFPEAVALAWRALALCQTILEEEHGRPAGANAQPEVKQEPVHRTASPIPRGCDISTYADEGTRPTICATGYSFSTGRD